eukprot:1812979-Amphidinium_carterae.1
MNKSYMQCFGSGGVKAYAKYPVHTHILLLRARPATSFTASRLSFKRAVSAWKLVAKSRAISAGPGMGWPPSRTNMGHSGTSDERFASRRSGKYRP